MCFVHWYIVLLVDTDFKKATLSKNGEGKRVAIHCSTYLLGDTDKAGLKW